MAKRFLISRLSSLGDVVCSLPAASALKRGVPDAHVTWAVDARFADIVRCCSAVDDVILRDAHLPTEGFDSALDLQGLMKSALIVSRAKAAKKVGYHWQREGSAWFSGRVLPDPSSLHVVDQYVDVARAVGGEADRAEFNLMPSPEAVESMVSALAPLATGRRWEAGSAFVVVNPGAAWASKRWPTAHFAELIDGLACPVVLIGSKGETAAEEVAAQCQSKPVNLSGQTTISELIALISLASAHVGGDTGSSHIAAALGIPAIGLYSATRPQRSCPYGQIHRCHYETEGLTRIQPSDVLKTVREAIA